MFKTTSSANVKLAFQVRTKRLERSDILEVWALQEAPILLAGKRDQ